MSTAAGFWTTFLGTLTGGGLLVFILKELLGRFFDHRLSKALAQHQHGLNEQLALLQNGMSRLNDVLGRRNEREFAVTEGAWERMIKAVGLAQTEFGQGRTVPAFRIMSEEDAQKHISGLPFREEQKEALARASRIERDDLYGRFELAFSVYITHQEFGEFKNWLSTRQIFFTNHIYDGFAAIRDKLMEVLIRARLYAEAGQALPTRDQAEIGRMLAVELNTDIENLAAAVRARFGFDGDTGMAPMESVAVLGTER